MPGPDYLQFKHAMEASRKDIIHSPRGTEWKNHKYIRKKDGRYIYPTGLYRNQNTANAASEAFDKKDKATKYGWMAVLKQDSDGSYWTPDHIHIKNSAKVKYETNGDTVTYYYEGKVIAKRKLKELLKYLERGDLDHVHVPKSK